MAEVAKCPAGASAKCRRSRVGMARYKSKVALEVGLQAPCFMRGEATAPKACGAFEFRRALCLLTNGHHVPAKTLALLSLQTRRVPSVLMHRFKKPTTSPRGSEIDALNVADGSICDIQSSVAIAQACLHVSRYFETTS
jgi:hypothetical protein